MDVGDFSPWRATVIREVHRPRRRRELDSDERPAPRRLTGASLSYHVFMKGAHCERCRSLLGTTPLATGRSCGAVVSLSGLYGPIIRVERGRLAAHRVVSGEHTAVEESYRDSSRNFPTLESCDLLCEVCVTRTASSSLQSSRRWRAWAVNSTRN